MKRRFSINEKGLLVDRDGVVLGSIESITLNIPAGGKGGSSSLLGELPTTTAKRLPLTPGIDPAHVECVWEYWVRVVEPRNTKITPSMVRLISKGLAEVRGPGDLCHAIDGMLKYREERGGPKSLGRILRTYPGGSPLRDQIEWWMEQAGEGGVVHGGSRAIDREEMIRVNRLKDVINSSWGKEHRRDEMLQAIERLQALGWKVERGEAPDARPNFLAP